MVNNIVTKDQFHPFTGLPTALWGAIFSFSDSHVLIHVSKCNRKLHTYIFGDAQKFPAIKKRFYELNCALDLKDILLHYIPVGPSTQKERENLLVEKNKKLTFLKSYNLLDQTQRFTSEEFDILYNFEDIAALKRFLFKLKQILMKQNYYFSINASVQQYLVYEARERKSHKSPVSVKEESKQEEDESLIKMLAAACVDHTRSLSMKKLKTTCSQHFDPVLYQQFEGIRKETYQKNKIFWFTAITRNLESKNFNSIFDYFDNIERCDALIKLFFLYFDADLSMENYLDAHLRQIQAAQDRSSQCCIIA